MENLITRKNVNFMLSIPTSDEEKEYYSLHASELKAFSYCLVPLQALWAFFDWKAISAILEDNLQIWQLAMMAKVGAFVVLLLLHWVLNVTAQTAYTKWFSGKKQIANFTIPAVIGLVMLGFSVFGAMTYTNTFTYKANVTAFQEGTYEGLKSEAQSIYESECATIRAKYEAKAGRKASAARSEIGRLNAKKIISDNDERWVKKLVRAQENIIAAASHQFDFAKNQELQKATDRRTARLESINTERSSTLLSHSDLNKNELQKEASGTASAHRFSWVISVLFMFLFYFFIYKIQKIKHFSGIKKESEMTPIEEHGGIIALTVGVFKDVFNRKYLAFLSLFHAKGVKGTQTVSAFDTRIQILQSAYLQPVENQSIAPAYGSSASKTPIGFKRFDNEHETVITPKTPLPTTEHVLITQGERYKELKQRIQSRCAQVKLIGKGRTAKSIIDDLDYCLDEIKNLSINPEFEQERKNVIIQGREGVRLAAKTKEVTNG